MGPLRQFDGYCEGRKSRTQSLPSPSVSLSPLDVLLLPPFASSHLFLLSLPQLNEELLVGFLGSYPFGRVEGLLPTLVRQNGVRVLQELSDERPGPPSL
jgi:hypothetical protein